MSSFDDIDREIDHEMGWDRGAKKGKGSVRRSPGHWQAILRSATVANPAARALRNILSKISKVVFYPIISPFSYSKHFDVNGDMVLSKRSLPWRIADGLVTRALLTPVIFALFLFVVVYASTHPRTVNAIATPDSYGLYYKRVALFTVDNQRLAAWYIPPINAEEVAFDPEGTLLQKWPAVVLAHGLGASHDQYLGLAATLHTAGFGVLLLDSRGQGESAPAAITYGLRERMDILAGVKFLRETTYVDPTKVCVIGHNISAMAALQAAALDSSIAGVVADGLWPRFEERASDIFARPNTRWNASGGGTLPTQWLAPLYSVAFEIMVRDRLSQLDPEPLVRSLHKQPLLFIAQQGPDYAPVQDVLTLATVAGGHHEVIMASPKTEDQIKTFLAKATGWKGPKARGTEQIEQLLKNAVPSR